MPHVAVHNSYNFVFLIIMSVSLLLQLKFYHAASRSLGDIKFVLHPRRD